MPTLNANINVLAADGTPIANVSIKLNKNDAGIKVTDSGAEISAAELPFILDAAKPGYVSQSIKIDGLYDPKASPTKLVDPPEYATSDPATTVSWNADSQRGLITIRLGRMFPAPAIDLDKDPSQLSRFDFNSDDEEAFQAANKKRKTDPRWKNTQLPRVFTRDQQQLFISKGYYEFARPNPANSISSKVFYAATGENLLNDETLRGWDVFNHTVSRSPVDPLKSGRFMFAEWGLEATRGDRTALRYLIGLWSPRKPSASKAKGRRDVILIFPPNTQDNPPDKAPYRGFYPYALQAFSPGNLFQSYPYLAHSFVFINQFLSYQLLAANTDALFIFLIQPFTQWERLGFLEGVSRLISECILFEHRHPPANPAAAQRDPNSKEPPTLEADALPPTLPDTPSSSDYTKPLPPPAVGSVALACYSAGVYNLKQLVLQNNAKILPFLAHATKPQPRTAKDEQKDPYAASPFTLMNAWTEIWDLDGSRGQANSGYASARSWGAALHTWQTSRAFASLKRRVRLYHTSTTFPDPGEMAPLAAQVVVGSAPGSGPKGGGLRVLGGAGRPINRAVYRKGGVPFGAKEWAGPGGTAVWMREDLLLGNGPAPRDNWDPSGNRAPKFWGPWPAGLDAGLASHWLVLNVVFGHAAANSSLSKFSSAE